MGMKEANFLITGIGGQGTLLASDILAEVGMRAGYDVKKSDVLGLAVRGGSVLSHVRWGKRVASPVVRKRHMDYLLAFELLEALRGIEFLHSESTILVNTKEIPPVSVSSGSATYPPRDQIESILRNTASAVHFVDAACVAQEIGNIKVTNVVLLGAFSALFDVPFKIWEEVVVSRVPTRYVKMNQAALRAGRDLKNMGGGSS
jgi:indolepyruvate ferredoxin oxidoreductase beta subunit